MTKSLFPNEKTPSKPNDADAHWTGMPDFEQEKETSYACVNIRFDSKEDLEKFNQLTGLRLTQKSKSGRYPFREPSGIGLLRWT